MAAAVACAAGVAVAWEYSTRAAAAAAACAASAAASWEEATRAAAAAAVACCSLVTMESASSFPIRGRPNGVLWATGVARGCYSLSHFRPVWLLAGSRCIGEFAVPCGGVPLRQVWAIAEF